MDQLGSSMLSRDAIDIKYLGYYFDVIVRA